MQRCPSTLSLQAQCPVLGSQVPTLPAGSQAQGLDGVRQRCETSPGPIPCPPTPPRPGSPSPAAPLAEAVVAVPAALALPARYVGLAGAGPRAVTLGMQGACGDPASLSDPQIGEDPGGCQGDLVPEARLGHTCYGEEPALGRVDSPSWGDGGVGNQLCMIWKLHRSLQGSGQMRNDGHIDSLGRKPLPEPFQSPTPSPS